MSVLGRVPDVGDVAEVFVPDRSRPRRPELRQQLAVLTVTHMDGLRIDRLALRLLTREARRVVVNSITAILLAVVLLLGNAFFVAAEFALVSARRTQIEPLAEAGNRFARTTLRAMENMSEVIAVNQLGITVCSLVLGAVGRADDRPADRAGAARPARARGVPAPGRLHDRPVDRGVPPRGDGRDDPEEHRAGRAGPCRPGAGDADLGLRDRAPPGDPGHQRRGPGAAAARRGRS